MGFKLTGYWGKAQETLAKFKGRIRDAVRITSAEIADELVAMVKQKMHEGDGWPPLHPRTAELKGSEKPLVGGELEAGIVAGVENGGLLVWVGVKDDQELKARVHEYGATIQITDKMRGYLNSQGFNISPQATHVVIPPRPFLRPALHEARPMIRARYQAALRKV